MIFKHVKTNLPAMYTSLSKLTGDNVFFIESASDMPDFAWSDHLNLPPEITRHGKEATMTYLQVFDNTTGPFYMQFLSSGFPDGKMPKG